MAKLLAQETTYEIIGAAMAVHRALGPGFLESVYHRGMEVELRHRGMRFETQKTIALSYREESLGSHVIDLVVADEVIVELKAVKRLARQHQAQAISYMRAAGIPVALLINFSKDSLETKRILLKDSFRKLPNPLNPLNPL